jgi:hypothetical protein
MTKLLHPKNMTKQKKNYGPKSKNILAYIFPSQNEWPISYARLI